MRKARARQFRPRITLPEPLMKEAVNDVVEMLSGRAPDAYTFHDVEEEYVVDPTTGEGRWQPLKPSKQRATTTAAAAEGKAGSSRRAERSQRRGKAADDDDEEELIDDIMTESE
eukprot:GHRR01027241.1.p1 GENE.GHRR01027241.1~~GHRR01027241.1.p1  ORF type:complete len:114 (+),score=47.31 GHRR01027241.1:329-670(+)